MDRFIQEYDPTQIAEVDLNNVTFCYDAKMVKHVSDSFAQQMIVQIGAVEFKTIKDLETIYEQERQEE